MTGKRRVGGPAKGAGRGSPRAEPFTAGNLVGLTHGARSRLVEPLADEIVAAAVEDAPYLAEPRYGPAVRAWGRSEAMAALLNQWLTTHQLHDEQGNLRPAEAALHRAEVRATNLRSRLGLDPLSAARLGRDVAATKGLLEVWDADDEQAEDEEGDTDGQP